MDLDSLTQIKKEFKVVGESKPGKPFLGKVKNDEAIKVFTGAYVIKKITNIDTVCMEEDTEKNMIKSS